MKKAKNVESKKTDKMEAKMGMMDKAETKKSEKKETKFPTKAKKKK